MGQLYLPVTTRPSSVVSPHDLYDTTPGMCGRYILSQRERAEDAFKVQHVRWEFDVSYNVAPTQNVPVVRWMDQAREGVMMRWGLVPFFARGEPPKYSTINARVETLETAAAYRGPWRRDQRCVLPAAGFYEWHLEPDGRKQPFFIHLADQDVFGFAGLWDRSFTADGRQVLSCTIITVPANGLMTEIHNRTPPRMPAILKRDGVQGWLEGSTEEARTALVQYPQELMVAWPVTPRVNSPKNNDPELIRATPASPG